MRVERFALAHNINVLSRCNNALSRFVIKIMPYHKCVSYKPNGNALNAVNFASYVGCCES